MASKKASLKKTWLMALAVVVGFAAVLGFFFAPTNLYLEVPGSAESLKPMVKVAGTRDTEKGAYMLTTVGIMGPASPFLLLTSKFRAHTEIISKQDLMGSETADEYDLLQDYYIKSAANSAVAAAFKAADRPVQVTNKGIYVLSILNNSPFKGKLKLGDTITAVNGKHYDTPDDYVEAIQKLAVGDTVRLTYTRKGKTQTTAGKLMRLPGTKKAGIGISLTAHTTIQTTPKVTIDAGEIGGPSAGLMFALETYTLITNQQLRDSRKIAGTGTIDAAGTVGQIGGIDKKVVVASREGATVFFAPDTPATKAILKVDPTYENNYDVAKRTAKEIGTNMRIVPVRTLKDALDYLGAKQG